MNSDQDNLREIDRDIVSALIFSKEGKLLMGKKDPKKGGVYSDCWHIPGGGVDDDETHRSTLDREIKEEVGLDISEALVELIDDQGKGTSPKTLKTGEKVICHMKFNIYKVQLDKDAAQIKLTPTDDLVELNWFSIEDLNTVTLTPPSTALFTRLGYLK